MFSYKTPRLLLRPLSIDTKNVITIGSDSYLPEYLLLPTWSEFNSNPLWNKFVMKVKPEDESNTRALSLKLQTNLETAFYSPCPGFDITSSPCAEWLSWHLLTTASSQIVQILKIKAGTNLNDPKLPTSLDGPFKDNHIPRLDSLPRRDYRKRPYNQNRSNSPKRQRGQDRSNDQRDNRDDQNINYQQNQTYQTQPNQQPQIYQQPTLNPQMTSQYYPIALPAPMANQFQPGNIPQLMYPQQLNKN